MHKDWTQEENITYISHPTTLAIYNQKLICLQCDQIWQNFATLMIFFKILEGLNSIGQHFEHILANYLCYWANVNFCKWPKIEHIIKPSGHTVCLLLFDLFITLYPPHPLTLFVDRSSLTKIVYPSSSSNKNKNVKLEVLVAKGSEERNR